jgi:hypothetical protein
LEVSYAISVFTGILRLHLEETNGGVKISHKDLDFKEIVDYLHSRRVTIYSAALEQPTLEDVFIQITGKRLRD